MIELEGGSALPEKCSSSDSTVTKSASTDVRREAMSDTRPPVSHDELVLRIYDAADDPRGFQDVLEEIGRQVGSDKAHLMALGEAGQLLGNHFYGGDASSFAKYEPWRSKDPRIVAATQRFGRVLSDVEVIDPVAFERSEIYNEHLSRVGVRYTLFSLAAAGPGLLAAPAFMRSANEGPFGAEEISRVQALLPHIGRVIRLRHLLESMRSEIDDLRHALDRMPSAVALLDGSGKVLCTNTAADEILARRDGPRVDKGFLSAARPTEARALETAIAQAAALADARTWRPAPAHLAPAVLVTRERGAPVGVVLLTLRPGSRFRDEGTRAARVLAVLHDPDRVIRLDPALVGKLHGLTATEAELATALAQGQTLADFADARGCSEQTARTHLKRILDKTGATRQADLVRVLLSGAALHQAR